MELVEAGKEVVIPLVMTERGRGTSVTTNDHTDLPMHVVSPGLNQHSDSEAPWLMCTSTWIEIHEADGF